MVIILSIDGYSKYHKVLGGILGDSWNLQCYRTVDYGMVELSKRYVMV
jgi:hypothetical protein